MGFFLVLSNAVCIFTWDLLWLSVWSKTYFQFPAMSRVSLMFVHCLHFLLLSQSFPSHSAERGFSRMAWPAPPGVIGPTTRILHCGNKTSQKKKLMKMGWATRNSFQILTFLYYSCWRMKRIEQLSVLGNGLVVWFSFNVFPLKKTTCCPTNMWRTHEPRQSQRC